jgi:hypothetical protein
VLAHEEAPLDEVRLFGFFELAGPLRQLAAALGAHLIGDVELVDRFDDRQLWLLAGTVAGLRLGLCLQRGARATPLAGVSKELLISRRELLLQLLELQRQVHLRLALERE